MRAIRYLFICFDLGVLLAVGALATAAGIHAGSRWNMVLGVATVLLLWGAPLASYFRKRYESARFHDVFLGERAGIDSKVCGQCGERVASTAKICRYCRADLTWKRHLHFTQTTLALLTALIAVTGSLGPQIRSMVMGDKPVIEFSLIESTRFQVAALIGNLGARTVSVRRIILLQSGKDRRGAWYTYQDLVPGRYVLVDARSSKDVMFLSSRREETVPIEDILSDAFSTILADISSDEPACAGAVEVTDGDEPVWFAEKLRCEAIYWTREDNSDNREYFKKR